MDAPPLQEAVLKTLVGTFAFPKVRASCLTRRLRWRRGDELRFGASGV